MEVQVSLILYSFRTALLESLVGIEYHPTPQGTHVVVLVMPEGQALWNALLGVIAADVGGCHNPAAPCLYPEACVCTWSVQVVTDQ